jgi:uncharacterized protein (DUF58 family)
VRRRPLTLRGLGAIALGVLLLVLSQVLGSSWALAFGVLLLALVVCGTLWLRLPRRAERVARVLRPATLAVGETGSVTLRVTNRSLLPRGDGRWSDALPAGLAGHAHGAFSSPPPALSREGTSVELTYAVDGMRRSTWEIGPVSLTETDPFGIARRTRRVGGTTTVTVTPRLLPLSRLSAAAGEDGGARATADRQGQGDDNLIPRPYAPGDSMRRVHWRASARLGELMVREEELESSPSACVVLDRSTSRWAAGAASPGEDAAFEAAVALCVSAAWRLASDGFVVEVSDADGVPLAALGGPGSATSEERERLLAAFTTIGTRSADALPRVADSAIGRGPFILVAGGVGPADAALLSSVPRRSGLPLLFAAAPAPGAIAELERTGWRAERLDVARPEAAWERAIAQEAPRAPR